MGNIYVEVCLLCSFIISACKFPISSRDLQFVAINQILYCNSDYLSYTWHLSKNITIEKCSQDTTLKSKVIKPNAKGHSNFRICSFGHFRLKMFFFRKSSYSFQTMKKILIGHFIYALYR